MFLINQEGRIVDLPHRMEDSGYLQAREILSISQELMDCQPTGVTMTDLDARKLRDDILKKYPNVVTDDVYMEQSGWNKKLEEEKAEVDSEEIVNVDMTKDSIIEIATQNGVKLSNQESRLSKAKLVELINGKHKR